MRALWILLMFLSQLSLAQVWRPDNGDGTYRNPVLHADYSDPDAIRVGEDYYMVASSFNFTPGLPLLHSRDLVNWTQVGYALDHLIPHHHYSSVRHGGGVWAPSIRYHKGLFYIYYPDPDFGIYVTTAAHISGPWSTPVVVKEGRGLIDPCPFWDEDGKVYLAYAFAGSRAGIKSVLMLVSLNEEGTKALNNDVMVFDGQQGHPTVEGPKMYKKGGYYYLSAPAGGVSTGWQLVLRSKNIYGPYEARVVLAQGNTPINGPHQGAWIDTPAGEWWFLHFQDKGPYGRVVHLQPMRWENDWPIMGDNGKPVLHYQMPLRSAGGPPVNDDEFNQPSLGLQWQWAANRQTVFGFPTSEGYFRLNTFPADSSGHLYDFPNFLSQKLSAETFMATTKISYRFNSKLETERLGFMIKGYSYAYLGITHRNGENWVTYNEWDGKQETEIKVARVNQPELYFRIEVHPGALATFSYSLNGIHFSKVDATPFRVQKGHWVGARIGYVAARSEPTNDSGFMNIDWFRTSKL